MKQFRDGNPNKIAEIPYQSLKPEQFSEGMISGDNYFIIDWENSSGDIMNKFEANELPVRFN